jgi:enterochelin esterase-like enzyme
MQAKNTLRLWTFVGLMMAPAIMLAQTPTVPAKPAPAAAPAATPAARPTPPTRAPDIPGAPAFTKVTGAGGNPPIDQSGDFIIGPDYVQAPEYAAVDGVPQGKVHQFVMDSKDSKFYPGIARDVFGTPDPNNPKSLIVDSHPAPYTRAITVYVPAKYKRKKPMPFLVMHDGPKFGDHNSTVPPQLLDNLIAQKRIPPIVVVAIQNGGGDAQGNERGLEYDTLSGKFAEFIQAEVLPAVEKNADVKLTTNPDGRAAMGCSSGAAAAFTMAWYHPEWYHRIVSYSGTYVNQQWPWNSANPGGAWDYHDGIIARAERKPIRIWMHVGDRDLFNPNIMRDDMHDWVVANHRMAKVLKEKGYEYQYSYALDSGHCDKKVREQTLPQALEWVWRGYQ